MKLAMTGISGSGKDYLVDILVKEYSYTRVSFSDQLKKLAVKIYPWVEEDYPAWDKEEPLNLTLSSGEYISKSPREIWLHLNSLREIEDGLFVRMLEEEVSKIKGNIVISDIRTENEWNWVNTNGYMSVYVNPMEKLYNPNKFDDFSRSLEGKTTFHFDNYFDGKDKFRKLLGEIIEK